MSELVLGTAALGRAIDAFGAPLDGGLKLYGVGHAGLPVVPLPSSRRALDTPLWTGVRAIDTLVTMARGARVGIFGPPGAGKSTLIESIVEGACVDAVVLALVGERGREAQAWIERIGPRETVVCATSDRGPNERIAAAQTAVAHAQALARRGLDVLVVLDSLARVAYALRESAASRAEPLGRGGYPAGVFSSLAQLLEGAGSFERGSVSLVATVLNDGDDRDPVSEAARSLLDGHIALRTDLAHAGRYPAIDILGSTSRSMSDVTSAEHRRAAAAVREALALLAAAKELRSLGIDPADSQTRAAIAAEGAIERLLRQGRDPVSPRESLAMLAKTADILGEPHGHHL